MTPHVLYYLFRYVTNQPPKTYSAFHPSGVGKWVPASARKAKACMVHSVSGWTRGVQVKLWDPSRTRAIPERLRGVFTTRRYTNPRLSYLTLQTSEPSKVSNLGCITTYHTVSVVQYRAAAWYLSRKRGGGVGEVGEGVWASEDCSSPVGYRDIFSPSPNLKEIVRDWTYCLWKK